MSKKIVIDELWLKVLIPDTLTGVEHRAIRRVLGSPKFRSALGRAVRQLFRRYASLAKVGIAV
jgi:hypothetical protein